MFWSNSNKKGGLNYTRECNASQFATRNCVWEKDADVDVLYISASTVHTCWGHSNLPSYISTHEGLGGLFFHSTKWQLREGYHCSSCSNLKNGWWWQRHADRIRFPPFNKPHQHKDETDYTSLPLEKSHVEKHQKLFAIRLTCRECWHAAVCSTRIYEYLYKWEVQLALALFGREGILQQ